MKSHWAFIPLLLLAVSSICETVWGTHQLEYSIEVHTDGSATLVIEHRFLLETGYDEMMFQHYSNLTYFTDHFVKKVNALVNLARLETGRADMSVTNFKMILSPFDSYRVVKYQYDWIGFAEVGASQIIVGDVFEVEGIFLHGEGNLKITYPPEYVVQSASPKPSVESDGTMIWHEVKKFQAGEPRIILQKRIFNIINALKENALMVISLAAIAGAASVGLWFLKFRKRRKKVIGPPVYVPPTLYEIQDNEEKVANLLKAAGGSLYQSTIAGQCGFSRSKTSRLLKVMEEEGKIKREKKGREKVVTLLEEVKGSR